MEALQSGWEKLLQIMNFELLAIGDYELNLKVLLIAVLIVVVTRVLATLIGNYILRPFFSRNEVDVGRSYAIQQITKYIVYIIGVASAFSVLGIEFSVLWATAAALLVGVGLGLQQTFNDFFGGLLLLIEGPVEVGNVIEVDGFIGRVSEIGLRTCKIRTRDDIMIIVPNSHLMNDNIINWSHIRSPLRFNIDVGVAYGSDVELVTRLLERSAADHPDVLDRPVPRIMFTNFGSSSLDFKLYFHSHEPWRIEFIKSDLRYTIDRLFRENQVSIPFPQQDLWIRNPESLNFARQAAEAASTPAAS